MNSIKELSILNQISFKVDAQKRKIRNISRLVSGHLGKSIMNNNELSILLKNVPTFIPI